MPDQQDQHAQLGGLRAPTALLDAAGRIVAVDADWTQGVSRPPDPAAPIGAWVVAECGRAFASQWCEVLEGRRAQAVGSFGARGADGRYVVWHLHVVGLAAVGGPLDAAVPVAAMFVVEGNDTAWEPSGFLDPKVDALAIADFGGRFVAVSPALERITGRSAEELRSRPMMDFVHPEDREATLRAYDQVRVGHDILGFRNRYIGADGRVRWLQWRATVRQDRGLVYSVAEDVTIYQRETLLLRGSQRVAAVGGFEIDFNTEQVFWSDEMFRLHGVSPLSFLPDPRSILDFFEGEDRARVVRAFEAARSDGSGFELECALRAADGAERRVRLVGDVHRLHGLPSSLRGAMQDVTAAHRLEQRLARTQELEAVGCVTGELAHDFANELTLVRSCSERLARVAVDADERDAVQDLDAAAERATLLARRLLGIAQRVARITGRGIAEDAPLPGSAPTPQAALRPTAGAARPAAAPLRVLVVEDDDLVRDLMRRGLETLGYAVTVAATAGAAEAQLGGAGGDHDVLVSDIGLPDADGRSLARRLRRAGRTLPVVFCSGRPDTWRDGDLEGCRFLAKPFTLAELDASLKDALAAARGERAAT